MYGWVQSVYGWVQSVYGWVCLPLVFGQCMGGCGLLLPWVGVTEEFRSQTVNPIIHQSQYIVVSVCSPMIVFHYCIWPSMALNEGRPSRCVPHSPDQHNRSSNVMIYILQCANLYIMYTHTSADILVHM